MNPFWFGRRVVVTGHTGFKGAWLALWLTKLGAQVFGFALPPEREDSLYHRLGLQETIDHFVGDVTDFEQLMSRLRTVDPDVVFHLAAQSIVRRSYAHPVRTWSTNVMGTVNLLEALRLLKSKSSVVVVTTDKVYQERDCDNGYRENDQLGGDDPYSASKAAAELAVHSFRRSLSGQALVKLASARAGNVIGGGDTAEDRIIPDLVRAFSKGERLLVRKPEAIRPWQHVLDPLAGYLVLAEALSGGNKKAEGAFNFGPAPGNERTVGALVETARSYWPGQMIVVADPEAPHEAARLSLSSDKASQTLQWRPRWAFNEAVRRTMEWYLAVHKGAAPAKISLQQITAYEEGNL